MAHFAKIENNVVIQVIVINDEDAPDPAPVNSEPIGKDFIRSIGLDGEWIQTSYNNNFRKQYASIGYTYDKENDVFIAPKPFASWLLDDNFDWQPPVPMPEGGLWVWDEDSLSWV